MILCKANQPHLLCLYLLISWPPSTYGHATKNDLGLGHDSIFTLLFKVFVSDVAIGQNIWVFHKLATWQKMKTRFLGGSDYLRVRAARI